MECPVCGAYNPEGVSTCGKCDKAIINPAKKTETTELRAGFWRRAAAVILDSIFLNLIFYVFYYSLFGKIDLIDSKQTYYLIIIDIIYVTFMTGKYGQTIGKMALGIKVVMENNDKVAYKTAFFRSLSVYISYIILCAGFLMVAFRKDKRALHDLICGTKVIILK
jgi:uncharacterized RDD family membrane protein YckC